MHNAFSMVDEDITATSKKDSVITNTVSIRIQVKGIYKKFKLISSKPESVLYNALHLFSWSRYVELPVLKNISFDVKSGEVLGIIGRNGSGKSTLLRIIAGIYEADSGIIKTNGQVVYLSGINPGLKENLTMKENIYLVCAMHGLSDSQILRKLTRIIEFSELSKYVDTPLFQFSSGMKSRLGFSIAIHCLAHSSPDILLLDEFIGGTADRAFQLKSLKKMEELILGGATVIIVSHSLEILAKYCNQILLLEDCIIRKIGSPSQVIAEYKTLLLETPSLELSAGDRN